MKQIVLMLLLFIILVATTILALANKISGSVLLTILAFIFGAILGYFPNAKIRIR